MPCPRGMPYALLLSILSYLPGLAGVLLLRHDLLGILAHRDRGRDFVPVNLVQKAAVADGQNPRRAFANPARACQSLPDGVNLCLGPMAAQRHAVGAEEKAV